MQTWKRRLFETRPVTRVGVSNRFGRWWFIYIMPLVFGFFAVLFVTLALSDWLPRVVGFGVNDPELLRTVGAIVFGATYLLGVWAMKHSFRARDSEFTE